MIDSFKLQESCFGRYIEINDIDIFDVYYPQSSELNPELNKEVKQLKQKTLDLLVKNIDNLLSIDWEKIINIVAHYEGFDYEYDSGTICDCCGTYDETTKYTLECN